MGKLVSLRQDHQPSSNSSFQSPKKVNLVAALVRGMLVKDALMQLELTIKRAAKTVYQGILISNCPRLCSEILDKLNHPFLPALSICFLPGELMMWW
ncbi:hypothetical protein GLYMA_15G277200v4 [Glycine max]|uniref:Uncharacterized protein n=2 Tax=Glycine subgen. Soja TaxID=1462606 RepID=A0A0R0GFL9_SOYBN|nr:hypothetical protein GYH30_043670 [Glycine max]KRH13992.1 hypothetical protein GLYMA_15G277200v4 [Glycine max]RZB73441.1 hypothetical protein D0Y65_037229 [Glycine soja]RZC18630.1 hypothetical protein D0Y65_005735 [Glycine soja]